MNYTRFKRERRLAEKITKTNRERSHRPPPLNLPLCTTEYNGQWKWKSYHTPAYTITDATVFYSYTVALSLHVNAIATDAAARFDVKWVCAFACGRRANIKSPLHSPRKAIRNLTYDVFTTTWRSSSTEQLRSWRPAASLLRPPWSRRPPASCSVHANIPRLLTCSKFFSGAGVAVNVLCQTPSEKVTSGGNNFNHFPDNQLTNFRHLLVDSGFYPLPLKFLWSIALRPYY